jgi:hypothetical protein
MKGPGGLQSQGDQGRSRPHFDAQPSIEQDMAFSVYDRVGVGGLHSQGGRGAAVVKPTASS